MEIGSEDTILITGVAGFIGSFLAKRLLDRTGATIVGLDNMNDYYDPGIKKDRLGMLSEAAGGSSEVCDDGFSCGRFTFVRADLSNGEDVLTLFDRFGFDIVVNLAAQAGVRYSIDNPRAYIDSNLIGFFNTLEACRRYPVKHLVYASSSSVYGMNKKVPYAIEDKVDNPVSLYAATKKSNELMAHAYSKLYDIPATGLRFFTVYGPMGRPDMAYFKFTDKIIAGEPIQIYNMGDMKRDFTYIDDIVEGLMGIMACPPQRNEDGVQYKVYNIGNSSPESLMNFVETLENILLEEGMIDSAPAHELLPMQPGDVYQTYADVSDLERDFGFRPATRLEDGLREFALWYKGYYSKKG